MTPTAAPPPRTPRLQPGLVAFHSNRAENLVEVVVAWLQRTPLPPLVEEVILVQSNGMAEWLKMELARRGGVCAATRVELPSRFLWRTYRHVLGTPAVPRTSPLDKLPMVWRLVQLLPGLLADPAMAPVWAPVTGFLRDGDAARLLQLATQLADLFDQYQNYRSDWLEAWAAGHDHLLLASGTAQALAPDQLWQSALWRALLATLSPVQQHSIRPRLHQQFLHRLRSGEPLAHCVAQRVTAFGMSQMPGATLEALAALAPHCQVILAIPNPCRYYWGDIMEGRDLLRAARRRQPLRQGQELAEMPLQDMHAHAHPLLAAWGRQSRDFVRQLDVFDDAPHSQQQFALAKIDYFDDSEEAADTPLLQQVQLRIRDLVPLHEHPARAIDDRDRSIVFHSAHSAVRELEVLHDQLLQALAQPAGPAQAALKPRDIIVMVPDIEVLAPAIRAVFGQYKRGDARFIPFDIADIGAQASSPLIGAVAWLLRLPEQRCRMSELLDLLEVPAVAARFGVAPEALPQLTQWMVGAGIRWGLDAAHRSDLGLGACGEQNSAWFGLRRMLLGYASGAEAVDKHCDAPPGLSELHTIAPYAEVGGLEAELAGSLAHLLQALSRWWTLATAEATPTAWAAQCQTLLADLLQADSEADRLALAALQDGLLAWQQACTHAGFDQHVPLAVLRTAWLQALELPQARQRFRAGGVTFCTLMPMRAIPFEVVCLLGMNDGDYPRRSSASDFDLMALPGAARPGDRSRRDDDRQLMLESVLSARRLLYISWSGRNVRDNAEQPASVLVAQLRDYLCAGWGEAVVSRRTTTHPLQPFSRHYFEAGSALFTYAREWRAMHQATGTDRVDTASGSGHGLAPPAHLVPFVPNPAVPLTLQQLTQFLRKPVKAFFRQRLLVAFGDDTPAQWDDERFSVGGLDTYQLVQTLLESAATAPSATTATVQAQTALARLRQSGALPLQALGDLAQQQLQTTLATMLHAWHAQQARFPHPAPRQPLRLQAGEVVLEDWVDGLRQTLSGGTEDGVPSAWLRLEPGNLCAKATQAKPRPEQLQDAWLRSLASAACGVQATGIVVGRDSVVEITPMPQALACATLERLLHLWHAGMQAPLPLPPKTALAWLPQANLPEPHLAKAQQAARRQYEGDAGDYLSGDVEDACMARVFPDFEALARDGQFAALAQAIYQPLRDWQKTHVTATLHSAHGADALVGTHEAEDKRGAP